MTKNFLQPLNGRGSKSFATLPALRQRASEILGALRDAEASHAQAPLGDVSRALKACGANIKAILAQTQSALDKLGARRVAAGDRFRLLQVSYRAYRLPETPDWLSTLLITMGFWLLEGGMAGAILISEGRMDVPAGLAYGLVFALVNIILGVLIGYLPLRYLAYRSPIDLTAFDDGADNKAQLIRRLSLFGLCAGLATEAVLIFGAARLRTLGTHEGVFTFTEVGFWATFNDSLAIIIAVIGTCSVILAVLKGYRGLDDPIPGFADAYLQATADIDDAAEDIAEQAGDAIEDASDAALERGEDVLADARDALENHESRISDIARSIDHFNNDVRSAREAARAQAQKDRGVTAYVRGRTKPAPTQSAPDAYDAMILPALDAGAAGFNGADGAEIAPLETALADLEATRDRCLAEIQTALAAFQASTPNLEVLFDEGDDNA